MHPKYEPKTPEKRRARVIEEIGEVLKAWGKWDRFGSGERHPNGGPTNAEETLDELIDLKGAIEAYLPDVRAIVERDASMAASNDNAKSECRHERQRAAVCVPYYCEVCQHGPCKMDVAGFAHLKVTVEGDGRGR